MGMTSTLKIKERCIIDQGGIMNIYPQFGNTRLTPKRILNSIQHRILNRIFPLNAFYGVYKDFAEATRSAPAIKPLGYDLASSEDWYKNKFTDVLFEDYPILFWLSHALQDSKSLFEVGGHMGEAFYAFSRKLNYPEDLLWTIWDVPQINESGTKLANKHGVTNLRFVDSFSHVEGADILFAAGSLQYIDQPALADMIRSFKKMPGHILINITPVYDGPSLVTLQNIGTVYCSYRIFNREELILSLDKIGYSLIDSWKKPREFRIKWYPKYTFDHYSGFYFQRR